MISAIQYRAETDADIQPHVHQRHVQEIVVQGTREIDYCRNTLLHVLAGVMTSLGKVGVSPAGSSTCNNCLCLASLCTHFAQHTLLLLLQ